MPTPNGLTPLEITFDRGYFPSAPDIPPIDFLGTVRRGSNVLLRPLGKLEVANGLLEVSSQNVGARIFAADIQRATIAGGLVGNRLPFAGLIRLDNFCLLFLSEHTDQQVFLNESGPAGLTTASSAGRLRVGIPDGAGGFTTVDAGFDKPATPVVTPTVAANETRAMSGNIGVAISSWRTKTNAIGPPSEIVNNSFLAVTGRVALITLPAPVTGQDGYIYLGTRWNDQGGELRVVRYIYRQPRGTFTATNGSPNLTAGVGTFWTRDLRPGDLVTINPDAAPVTISAVTSDTTATLAAAFGGATNSGKTMIVTSAAGAWQDSELGALVSRDTIKPPRAAGILKHANRAFLWGIPDTNSVSTTAATGPSIAVMLDNNPEHVGVFFIATESGSDLVSVLGVEGGLYLMTTTGLEIVRFTNDPDKPYIPRIAAEPGFMAATNGCVDGDFFYGFNGMPLRTKIDENIDDRFAEPVRQDMECWDATRVMLAVDPKNRAVLYMHDDGAASTVRPYMAQLSSPGNPVWGPPLNFGARIVDSQVVNGALYVTYLSGGNYRVNRWEGGAGIGGDRYFSSQYIDPRLLAGNRLKRLQFVGKGGTLRVYAAPEEGTVPDVSNPAAATESFTLSDTDKVEPEIKTNILGKAYSLRVDFSSDDGKLDKLVASGTPIGR